MDPVPDDVRRFLQRSVETVDRLELLRVLGGRPGVSWEPAALARAAEANPDTAAADLAALAARGLVAADGAGGAVAYRHGPAPEQAEALARALEFYRERPVSAIRVIYERPADPVRTLADAFRFRKGG